MSVGKRIRFEVLKRDGFRCAYCGVTSVSEPLHVDHVIPASKGGTDDMVNLVTSCAKCNLGKSNTELGEVASPPRPSADLMREHAAQVAEYLEAQRELIAAIDEMVDFLEEQWERRVGRLSDPVSSRLRTAVRDHDLVEIVEAMDATDRARKRIVVGETLHYFNGVLRNMRSGR